MGKDECANLHNKIAEVIVEQKASPQDTLYVLDLVRQEIIEGELKKIFAEPKLSNKTPTEITS